MASNEEDLIDLGNDACVARVAVDNSTTLEEQEHLLDVCPPKLEQKLSLTRQRERVHDSTDNGDILVTLGHDQVVPIRKRIDVVSSDTIKRVRDITRNLEPVIRRTCSGINEEAKQNTVDYADGSEDVDGLRNSTAKHVDETYEAREISNAFDFLAEHDDNDDRGEIRRSISHCNDQRTTVVADESRRNDQLDNPPYESSPEPKTESRAKRNREDAVLQQQNKRRSLAESHRKSWTEGTDRRPASTDRHPTIDRSSSLQEYRCASPTTERGLSSFLARSSPEEESATTTTTTTTATTSGEDGGSDGSEVDWSWLEEVEYLQATEQLAAADEYRGGSASPTNEDPQRRRGSDHREIATRSVAMSVTATAKSLAVGGSRWPSSGGVLLPDRNPLTHHHRRRRRRRDDNNDDCGAEDDNAASEAVDRENRDVVSQPTSTTTTTTTMTPTTTTTTSTTTGNSWMRASMRRLRHLRLPEGAQRAAAGIVTVSAEPTNRRPVTVSAPNSLPDIALIAPEILAAQTNDTSGTLLRPSSAPARNAGVATPRRTGRQFTGGAGRSRDSRNRHASSSRQGSLGSTTTASDTTASGTTTCSSSCGGASTSPASSTATSPQRTAPRRLCERQRDVDRRNDRGEDEDEDENPLGRWPHALSPALACLGCTLGLFNISRFAILSIQFGANFIVQFLILSLILGIPLLTLQVCLGQRLAAGSVDMWRISPLFQGVGIALLTAQAFIGIYSIVGISWMFVYFRDSFITKQDKYRWAEPFLLYREDNRPTHNATTSYKLYETVPDYFSGAVLQRHHLNEADPGVVTLKFQVAFNLAVVWMIVFVSLSKGLRSYGKVVYVFTLVPVFGTLVLCTKLLGLTPPGSIHQLFPATVWSEFFINGKSWVAASNEVFLTWGLLGAAAMQIAAHNKHKHLLQRDTSLVIVLTFVVLFLAAFLANTCVQILRHHGYIYTTSSFERISGYTFMRFANQPAPSGYSSTPERFMAHASFLLGQRVTRPGADTSTESGYQVLRLSTELVPATLALLGTEQVSPFWAVLFYFILILFGIAQQLAIWHCVITGIMAINAKMMKLWETTITFFSCACAYILGLPMATELGIYVVYYLDYTVGGAWWIIVLYLMQIGAVFAVRGRPHTGEAVVAELFPPTGRCLRYWAGPLLSFTWNVVLPVTLMVLSITIFKSSGFRELYSYRRTSRDYWAVWARQLGAAIQLIPILMIPAVAIIQTCRYLNNGPPDIFDNEQMEVTVNHCEQCNGRIQLLYRPALEPEDPRDSQNHISNDTGTSLHGNGILPSATTEIPFEDPPPKYTPPPSYTTATGARIAKMLRQSFRRSVRRIANVLGESSASRQRPALQPPPPDYATVLVEMNLSGIQTRDIAINVAEPRPDVTNIGSNRRQNVENVVERHRPNTIDRTSRIGIVERRAIERTHSTLDRGRRPLCAHTNLSASNLTAADVANLLRSSIRRGTVRTQQSLRRSFCHEEPTTAVSVENLVEAAAPISEDSLVLSKDTSLVPNELLASDRENDADDNDDDEDDEDDDDDDEKKTAAEMDSSVSVI